MNTLEIMSEVKYIFEMIPCIYEEDGLYFYKKDGEYSLHRTNDLKNPVIVTDNAIRVFNKIIELKLDISVLDMYLTNTLCIRSIYLTSRVKRIERLLGKSVIEKATADYNGFIDKLKSVIKKTTTGLTVISGGKE